MQHNRHYVAQSKKKELQFIDEKKGKFKRNLKEISSTQTQECKTEKEKENYYGKQSLLRFNG